MTTFIETIERMFNEFVKGQPEEVAKTVGKPDQEDMNAIQTMTQTNLAGTLLKLENKHVDQEKTRLRWMRVMALVIGTVLAFLLKIDAIVILKEAFPSLNTSFNQELKLGLSWLPHNPTPGMVLTGLAASAGSKFWHDFLSRLEATKKEAENAAKAIQSVKRSIPGVEDK